jgi:uncharacterized protein (TIGR03067 family)
MRSTSRPPTWTIKEVRRQLSGGEDLSGTQWVIEGKTVLGKLPRDGPSPKEFTIDTDPTSSPSVVNIRHKLEPNMLQGIYVLDGDMLTFCWQTTTKGRRPKVAEVRGPDTVLVVLERKLP